MGGKKKESLAHIYTIITIIILVNYIYIPYIIYNTNINDIMNDIIYVT
jgi:hypothetical protein